MSAKGTRGRGQWEEGLVGGGGGEQWGGGMGAAAERVWEGGHGYMRADVTGE